MKQGEKNKLYSFGDKMPDGRLTEIAAHISYCSFTLEENQSLREAHSTTVL